ncbi:DUF748 domain-containing protein [Colwellia sp. C1TZA3]|uniref:DUF748 domain-containing protein n=1 Tax=Colwellia sp. C1TZA3 TaxID=2508879 RepID=UPI0011BA1D30|nr:DUF748 domain-containing protein [Colwellia sp. C1TZA3]TWX70001.1 DUF748 domain-containing protein [Colwellia sp. C1TZA3]
MGRYFKRLSQILVISFILLYSLIWLLSPVIIRYALNTYGLPKPLLLTSASSIRYNPFTAHLTISHLEVKTNEQSSVLRLQSLNAELHLHQLLFDKIYVAEFTVNGLFIPVTVNESSLNVAGVELRSENSTALATEAETKTEQAGTNFPYQVIIPQFTLTDAHIELLHFSQKHNIQLDSFSLQNILLTQNEQEIKLNLVSHLNGARVEVALDGRLLKQQGQISIDLNAKNIALNSANNFLPRSISVFDGKVSYASKMDIVISDEQTSVKASDLIASVDDLHVEQNNIAIAIKRQKIQAKDLAVLLQPNKPINVDVMLNYVIEELAVKSKESKALLAEISNLSANNIALQFQQNMTKVTIEKVQVANSEFSKNSQQNLPALASFNHLSVNNIEYTPELIAVNNITLSGLVANVLLDKEKKLATLVASANNDDKKTPDTEQENNTADNKLVRQERVVDETNKPVKPIFRLGQFSLLDGAQIDFKDSSVTPYYERNVNITHLLLSDVDSGKPEQGVVLDMQGKSDKYASFDLKGRGLPFAPQQKFTLDAVVKEVSLPGISSYIKDALQYEIESGQLDIKLKTALTGNQLNGDIDLLLRGIEFTSADDHERGVIKEQFSVPFNVALGMLKDSDGNVALSLPLTGDTRSPSFGLSGLLTLLVKQATMSAAKDYLITTFVPYASVMKVAMAAGEFALKLRINDLNYLASATELNTEQLEFSRQMSVMLGDRDKVNVKLCAIATASDIELTDASQAHQPENIARLNILSQQRVEVFKAHMVEQLKVPSARLLFCTPQIDTSNGAKPRIKFVI